MSTETNESEALKENWATQLREKLQGQQWFQELEGIWNGLDAQQQNIAKIASTVVVTLLVFYGIFSVHSSVSTLQADVDEKQSVIDLINRATEETAKSKSGSANGINVRGIVSGFAASQNLPEGTIEVIDEKPGPSLGAVQEMYSVIHAKAIGVRGLADFLTQLDNPTLPLKIRKIEMETLPEATALSLKLFVSTFKAKEEPTK